jgi:ADP-heptose:LPS heptosyltransferase
MITDPWQEAENVLCVRLDALGDVLMSTPALRALKEGRPLRRLTLLTSPAAAPLAPLIPEVGACLIYDAPWMKATVPRWDSSPDLLLIKRLQRRNFDAAVIFTVYSQNPLPAALLCLLADIPRRLAHCRENPYQLLTDWVREPEPAEMIRHEGRRQLDLVATVGCRPSDERLSLRVPPEAYRSVEKLLAASGVDPHRSWVLVHPGASAPSRRYPPERFVEAADLLAGEHGLPVVFSGTAPERELVEGIRSAMRSPSHSLAGRLELAELIARASVLVTG